MNIFKEAVYRSHLEHSAKGQSWGQHKYIAIKNGRYIYPEDLKGDKHNEFKRIDAVDKNKQVIAARKKWIGGTGINTGHINTVSKNSSAGKANEKAALEYSVSKTPHEGSKVRARAEYKKAVDQAGKDRDAYIKARQQAAKEVNAANAASRSRQINDQINSAHVNATSSTMDLTPGSELKKRAEERKAANAQANSVSVADQIKAAHANAANHKSNVTAPAKKEETPATASTTTTSTTDTTEEKKSSGKSGGKKGGSKKSSKAKTEETTTTAAASEEAQTLGLTDEDIKILDDNIDLNATDRDTVIKNLALRVIKGDFGNGPERRRKLGKYYNDIQKMVNQLIKEMKTPSTAEVQHSDYYAFNAVREKGAIGVHYATTNYLMHVGNRNSGRYKRGSGDRPWQHEPGHYMRGQQRNEVLDRLNRRSTTKDLSDDELKKAISRNALERQYNKINKGPDRLEKTKNVIDATSAAVNRANNKNREKMNRRPKKERMDLHDKTDKELRDAINRELLEKQYSDLFGKDSQTVSKGEEQAAKILDYAGDVLAVGSSALAIALAIKSLKG